jgi:hypothetical protein
VTIPRSPANFLLDEAYAKSLERRFGERFASGRPEIWPIAVDPERTPQRAWINDVLSSLPLQVQRVLRHKLEKNSSFLATYNELALGALLRQPGCELGYEVAIDDPDGGQVTPDWTIENAGREIAVFEITTQFRPVEARGVDHKWAELKDKVAGVPFPFVVLVRCMADRFAAPDSGTAKLLARRVAAWLARPATKIGDEVIVDGYSFGILGVAPGLRAMLSPPTTGAAFDADMIVGTINEKVSRYAAACEARALPLVIVLAAEAAAPMDLGLLKTALAGTQTVRLALDPFAPVGQPIASHSVQLRQFDKPAPIDPSVSAIGWLDPGVDTPGRLTLMRLPEAVRPIDFLRSTIGEMSVGPS